MICCGLTSLIFPRHCGEELVGSKFVFHRIICKDIYIMDFACWKTRRKRRETYPETYPRFSVWLFEIGLSCLFWGYHDKRSPTWNFTEMYVVKERERFRALSDALTLTIFNTLFSTVGNPRNHDECALFWLFVPFGNISSMVRGDGGAKITVPGLLRDVFVPRWAMLPVTSRFRCKRKQQCSSFLWYYSMHKDQRKLLFC